MKNDVDKTYCNSWACILSVMIILFIVCSIGYDMIVVYPQMKESIEDIRVEVRNIRQKIDKQYNNRDTIYFNDITNTDNNADK